MNLICKIWGHDYWEVLRYPRLDYTCRRCGKQINNRYITDGEAEELGVWVKKDATE